MLRKPFPISNYTFSPAGQSPRGLFHFAVHLDLLAKLAAQVGTDYKK
jgi:hypothetical protein